MHSQLLIGSHIRSPALVAELTTLLTEPGYCLQGEEAVAAFLQWVGENRHRIDCLLVEECDDLQSILDQLRSREILLPIVLLTIPDPATEGLTRSGDPTLAPAPPACSPTLQYHSAIACLPQTRLTLLEQSIHQAIDDFLHLSHAVPTPPDFQEPSPETTEDTRHFLLSLQQQRLTEKLRERLGYLGVYYKRNPQNFLRNLSREERTELMGKLKNDYRAIVLSYFAKQGGLNQRIDDFVNVAFFSDVSVAQIVEIHMDLMDDFSKQLKLEGRSEEILLDYRLTLIDVIAHLCEMYRRSIPREI